MHENVSNNAKILLIALHIQWFYIHCCFPSSTLKQKFKKHTLVCHQGNNIIFMHMHKMAQLSF